MLAGFLRCRYLIRWTHGPKQFSDDLGLGVHGTPARLSDLSSGYKGTRLIERQKTMFGGQLDILLCHGYSGLANRQSDRPPKLPPAGATSKSCYIHRAAAVIAGHDSEHISLLNRYRDNVLLVEGQDDSTLIIAFTSGDNGGGLMMDQFEFMELASLTGYSRIHVSDPWQMWYLNGINSTINSFARLTGYLHNQILLRCPQQVLVVGTSLGGYGALLAGHAIRADYVHALGPQTSLDPWNFYRYRDTRIWRRSRSKLLRVYRRNWWNPGLLDLRRRLRRGNGRTTYYLHVCAQGSRDLDRARHLQGLPGVCILSYPCTGHSAVIGEIARQGFLTTMLNATNQPGIAGMHADLYANTTPRKRKPETPSGDDPLLIIGEIVRSHSLSAISLEELHDAGDLGTELGLESIGRLEILVALENHFGVTVDVKTVTAEDFSSLASLHALVQRSPA